MTSVERLIENIICQVQSMTWYNAGAIAEDRDKLKELHEQLGHNGIAKVDLSTFMWLWNMAVYVVFHATVWNESFKDKGNDEQR